MTHLSEVEGKEDDSNDEEDDEDGDLEVVEIIIPVFGLRDQVFFSFHTRYRQRTEKRSWNEQAMGITKGENERQRFRWIKISFASTCLSFWLHLDILLRDLGGFHGERGRTAYRASRKGISELKPFSE